MKNCQLRYYTMTLIAVSAAFGASSTNLVKSLGSDPSGIYLVPLLIIIPSWILIYDKAKTITRIVGFQRVIETALTNPTSGSKFITWEKGLEHFRSDKKTVPCAILSSIGVFFLVTRQKYWVILFHTHLFASVLCLIFGFPAGYLIKIPIDIYMIPLFWCVAAGFVAASSIYSAVILVHLTVGKNTYGHAEEKWSSVVDSYGTKLLLQPLDK